jgi:sulfide:quinone oxidoreductase
VNDIKQLAEGICVSPFKNPKQIPALAESFRTLINNRPDGEEPGQATSAELEAAAKQAGLRYRHIPVQPGRLENEQISAFCEALSNEPKPVLAFCKSGTRSASLWALSQAGKRDPDSILGATAAAGYNLQVLKPLIQQRTV